LTVKKKARRGVQVCLPFVDDFFEKKVGKLEYRCLDEEAERGLKPQSQQATC